MIFKPKHFALEELVCPHAFKVHGEMAWQFFDERILMTLDFLRDKLTSEIYVNNWDSGGNESQRGLRCVLCELVKDAVKDDICYCSAHLRGQAMDITVKGMTTAQVRLWIVSNPSVLPFPVRLEKKTNGWNHIDVCNSGTMKVELFNA